MSQFAYITLLTKSSYLAGVIILAHSLNQRRSSYPLIVCYTPSLPNDCIQVLQDESKNENIILRPTEPFQPPNLVDTDLIAERFRDTWTKLRVFQPQPGPNPESYTRLCYLDADMMLLKNLDYIFQTPLPGNDWIAANHACVCNPDSDSWAPSSWRAENCAYTPHNQISSLVEPTLVPKVAEPLTDILTEEKKHTYTLLNSGLFLFTPSENQWDKIRRKFESLTRETLKNYKFPDQDFLTEFFRDHWMSLPWNMNALKTMRYSHDNIWQDEAVVNLHYIVDKPWAGPRPVRITDDLSSVESIKFSHQSGSESEEVDLVWSKTGFKGRDGETHSWWWKSWDDWKDQRTRTGETRTVTIVEQYIHGGGEAKSRDMDSIGCQVQAFALNIPDII